MATLGPILQFLGTQNNTWGISLLLLTAPGDPPPVVQFSAPAQASPPASGAIPGFAGTAWRIDVAVAQAATPLDVNYQCDGQAFRFQVPAQGGSPNLGYVSCNGFSDLRVKKTLKEPQGMWSRLDRLHQQIDRVDITTYGPLHLLLMGGDQIYSDDMWTALPELLAWTELPWDQRVKAPFTATLRAALQAHYAQLYIDHWRQPEQAKVLASVPTVMMWDDHDIIDGWGSHPTDLHESPVFQGIYTAAKAAFEIFQRHMLHGAPPPATLPAQDFHNSGYRFGSAGLLVLDMRSERRPRRGDINATGGLLNAEQVMSEKSWHAVYQWLDAQAAAVGADRKLTRF